MKEQEFKNLIEKAESGDAQAQFELGAKTLTDGFGSYFENGAIHYWELAEKNGCEKAHKYLERLRVDRQYFQTQERLSTVRVEILFEEIYELAEKGSKTHQCDLGNMYANGAPVKRDYEQAVYWWAKAAQQGHMKATLNLGWASFKGLGVEKDNEIAKGMFELVVEKGGKKLAQKARENLELLKKEC